MRKLMAICVFSLLPLVAGAVDTADQQLRTLLSADWQWRLQTRPEYATAIGEHRFNHTLSDTSLAASRAALLHHRSVLQQARAIAAERLPAQDRLSLELFIHEQEETLRLLSLYPWQLQPISNQDGLHIRFGQMVAQMPFASESDYRNYLARLDAVPAHVDGLVEQLREAMVTGWVAPKTTVAAVPAMLRAMRESIESGALAAPFYSIPATITPAAREEFAQAGPAALRTKVAPALQTLEDFLRNDYLPAARDSISASALPDDSYYTLLAAQHSGGAQTPAEIHALGLREVERIRTLIRAVIPRTGFKGSFAQFSAFVNSDRRMFYTRPDKLLARYRRVVSRANAQLPRLFLTLPSEDLVIKPAARANGEAVGAAYYEEGSARRPAGLVVNTARLDARPIWEVDALALHEGVPGHHLQVARAHQLAGLPAFRRHAWYPAYGEGWALYAESLGYEMGFYKDAFSAFGQLNSELLRAARMVADTGIHAMGWTRQQAIDYLNANTANALADNEIEVDRYIAQPARALSYKAGQLRIQALRARAQMVLGERFDVRQFHEAVLANGPLPLPILERQVGRWMAETLDAAYPAPPPRPAGGA